VTDAAWSPDGSRIAFVDGDGNIATAKPDGTGLYVLTKAASGVVRSRPSWSRSMIFFAEKRPDGTSALVAVPGNGCAVGAGSAEAKDWDMDTGDGTSYVDLSPSAALSERPSRVAFQHEEPGGSEVWINDTNQRSGPSTAKIATGSDPAFLPDGTKLAFVGANGQIYVRDGYTDPVQITFGADKPHRLTWTPDGKQIAYSTSTGVEAVSTSPGANTNPPTKVSDKPGVPTYLGAQRDRVSRINGTDPIGLAIAASQARWPTVVNYYTSQSSLWAFGATLTTPDAVSEASAQQPYPGPTLLTDGGALDPRTAAELQRILGRVDKSQPSYAWPTITITSDAISASVERALKDMGYTTKRLPANMPAAGPGEGTCAPQGKGSLFGQTLVVADASSKMDSSIAAHLDVGGPLMRVDGKAGLTDVQRDYLARSAPFIDSIYIVDGSGAIPAELEKQIGVLISGPLSYAAATNPTVPPRGN
jgi:hypothetical protein